MSTSIGVCSECGHAYDLCALSGCPRCYGRQPDEVISPAHYTQGDIECIDAIRAQLSEEEWRGFLRGQVAKYTWRLGRKGERDAEKMLFYATLLAGRDPRG
jgi:hypothetical protein